MPSKGGGGGGGGIDILYSLNGTGIRISSGSMGHLGLMQTSTFFL